MEPSPTKTVGAISQPLRFGRYAGTLLEATRPHFFAFPVGAVWAGVAATHASVSALRLILVALIAGGGWGAGQLLNDVLDREADAIDAPHRPAVRGLLPAKLTIALALAFGLTLLALLSWLTPSGWILGAVSMAFILTYNRFKGVPLAGNVSHGLLVALAALIGATVAEPSAAPLRLMVEHSRVLILVGLWSALYLQANYEKDAIGDAAAGYRTLAHVLGIRTSSWCRAGLTLVCVWFARPFWTAPFPLIVGGLSALAIAGTAIRTAQGNSSARALSGYRLTVHGGTLGMLSFGADALPPLAFGAALGAAIVLTEFAFRRNANP